MESIFTQEVINRCVENFKNGLLFVFSLFTPYITEAVTDVIKFGLTALFVILLITYFGPLVGLTKCEIKRLINLVRKIKDLLSGINSFMGLKK